MPPDPLSWIADELAQLDAQQLRRRLVERSGAQGPVLPGSPRSLVNFASNDYLSLAADPRLSAAAQRASQAEGWGAGASPLVSGYSTAHAQLERRLAEWLGTEAALVFSSGYAANVGAVTALAGRGDAVFGDAKNHASLIDGCRLSRAEVFVFPHRDYQALAEQLSAASGLRRRLIVSDSLFSMDGDCADLAALADLAERFDAMLLVDEAHATGVFGTAGTGLVEASQLANRVPVRIGTLSKALGSAGGFVAGSRLLIDWLANRARSYVFSTAHPPAVCAAATAALDIVRDEPWRRVELLARAGQLRERLRGRLGYRREPEPDHSARLGRSGPHAAAVRRPAGGGFLGAGHPAPVGPARRIALAHQRRLRPHRRPAGWSGRRARTRPPDALNVSAQRGSRASRHVCNPTPGPPTVSKCLAFPSAISWSKCKAPDFLAPPKGRGSGVRVRVRAVSDERSRSGKIEIVPSSYLSWSNWFDFEQRERFGPNRSDRHQFPDSKASRIRDANLFGANGNGSPEALSCCRPDWAQVLLPGVCDDFARAVHLV